MADSVFCGLISHDIACHLCLTMFQELLRRFEDLAAPYASERWYLVTSVQVFPDKRISQRNQSVSVGVRNWDTHLSRNIAFQPVAEQLLTSSYFRGLCFKNGHANSEIFWMSPSLESCDGGGTQSSPSPSSSPEPYLSSWDPFLLSSASPLPFPPVLACGEEDFRVHSSPWLPCV